MKRFFTKIGRFFWSWGFLKFVLAVIALIIFFYVEEDWRGARAWAATKAEWEAKGETFDFNKFIPASVPDNQNLAAIPIFKLEPDPTDAVFLVPLKLRQALNEDDHGGELPRIHATANEIRAGVAAAYVRTFPGKKLPADTLAQFEALYPIIPELRAAAAVRPYCRFNQDYEKQPPMLRSLWLLTEQISLSQRLRLHAAIALDENQPQVALDDIKLNFRLAAGVGRDPTLVAGLVAIGITAITRGAIDEGLARHAWSDAELVDLQSELVKLDFLSQYQFTLRGETITETIPDFDYIKATRKRGAVSIYGLCPGGWFDRDKSKMIDFLFRELKSINPKSRRAFPENTRKVERETEQAEALPWRLAPWNLFFAISAPMFTNLSIKFAQIQASLDEDRIACALERYRLAHGVYPGSLDALAPTCIDDVPHDIMSGEPYHYRLRPDGTFLLYSVGWNQTDEGGKVVYKKDAPSQVDYEQGDWPWPTPQAAPDRFLSPAATRATSSPGHPNGRRRRS